MAGDGERPSKRLKLDGSNLKAGAEGAKRRGKQGKRKDPARAKYRAQAATSIANGRAATTGTTTISASGLHSGDVGILVTSDKGCEKRALREAEDLLSEFIDAKKEKGGGLIKRRGVRGIRAGEREDGSEDGGEQRRVTGMVDGEEGGGGGVNVDDRASRESDVGMDGDGEGGGDIEKDILAELEELREASKGHSREGIDGTAPSQATSRTAPTSSMPKLGLITLDIPCVSFVRLPQPQPQLQPQHRPNDLSATRDDLDPVDLVYEICREAHKNILRQRSRYIKRLTPVQRVRKVMNDGVERLCEEVLPTVFAGSESWRYAVRVTVRNNNQVNKEEIIKTVAGYVVRLGRGEVDWGLGSREERDEGNTSSEDEGEEDGDNEAEEDEGHGVENERRSKTVLEGDSQPTPTFTSTKNKNGRDGKELPRPIVEHRVSLKNYEKLVIVEIYRNVVGMSVVGEARDFEGKLKRFNLSEIYAEGRKRMEGNNEVDEEGKV